MAIDMLSVNPFVKTDLPDSATKTNIQSESGKEFDSIFTGILNSVNLKNISPGNENATKIAELVKLEMMRSSMSMDGVDSESTRSGSEKKVELILKYFDEYKKRGSKTVDTVPEGGECVELQVPGQTINGLGSIIDKASRVYGIDPGLIRAVIRAESNFNPRAVSTAGAQGLMQLMPSTARGLGVTNSFDPEQNVMAGTKFLKQMLNRYDGNLNAALAAYNWGPGNLEKKGGELPLETREYMKKVKGYYAEYSA